VAEIRDLHCSIFPQQIILANLSLTQTQDTHRREPISNPASVPVVSIIIPTYNESENIINLIQSIRRSIAGLFSFEIIVVDDNSPDGTAKLVVSFPKEEGTTTKSKTVNLILRQQKNGLGTAILEGLSHASGDIVVVMDADFSHPPDLIPEMICQLTQNKELDLIIASRYIEDGGIEGWSIRRRLISLGATKVAQYALGIKKVKDPMSGFFAIRRSAIRDIKFDAIGYKILLEILVKADLHNIIELPYTFKNRKEGSSKLDNRTIIQYLKACRKLYSYKQDKEKIHAAAFPKGQEDEGLHRFVKKMGKFYIVGALGLLVNYGSSFLMGGLLFNMYYMHATVLGIGISIVSNFLLNKLWTFNDRDFSPQKVARQGFLFLLGSIIGITIQIGLVYYLVQEMNLEYIFSLGLAVLLGSSANFLLAKKLAFKERLISKSV
jgi:dolichol-phosphate mannosyltransferase